MPGFGYDTVQFAPPAPVAKVRLRDPASGDVVADVPMVIDTGADVTLLPRTFVERLGVRIETQSDVALVGFDGSRSTPFAVSADLVFLSGRFRGLFLLRDGAYGVIGRDVLNHFHLALDGPRLTWERIEA